MLLVSGLAPKFETICCTQVKVKGREGQSAFYQDFNQVKERQIYVLSSTQMYLEKCSIVIVNEDVGRMAHW